MTNCFFGEDRKRPKSRLDRDLDTLIFIDLTDGLKCFKLRMSELDKTLWDIMWVFLGLRLSWARRWIFFLIKCLCNLLGSVEGIEK